MAVLTCTDAKNPRKEARQTVRATSLAAIGGGATVAVIAAGLVQAAGDTPQGQILGLSVSVPADYKGLIEDAGQTCPDVSPNLLAALLTQESGFNSKAESPAGARGIAQFMPATWATHGIDGNGDGKRDVWDPEDAIPSSAKYLCSIAADVKDVPGDRQRNILAAYNAGSGAVRKYQGIPPYKETRNYVKTISTLAEKPPPSRGTGKTTTRQAGTVIKAANKMIGTPYSWGGGNAKGPSAGTCCSPNGSSGETVTGFDCSGLTVYAYAQAGITLPRTAAQQYAASKPLKPQQIRPGDLVFYGNSPEELHHVGIYIGDGWMIDAPRPGAKVRYSPMDTMRDLYGVARPTPDQTQET